MSLSPPHQRDIMKFPLRTEHRQSSEEGFISGSVKKRAMALMCFKMAGVGSKLTAFWDGPLAHSFPHCRSQYVKSDFKVLSLFPPGFEHTM